MTLGNGPAIGGSPLRYGISEDGIKKKSGLCASEPWLAGLVNLRFIDPLDFEQTLDANAERFFGLEISGS